ncbi:MAG: GFA family protein [Patulibacter sp.]
MESVPASSAVYSGGCLCAGVRYRASSGPINERVCHCWRCQRVLGAAFNARLLFAAADLQVDGYPRWHQISASLEAGSCESCGSTLLMRRTSAATISVLAGSLDRPDLFEPTMHVHTASMQAWIHLTDGLPRHAGAPPC